MQRLLAKVTQAALHNTHIIKTTNVTHKYVYINPKKQHRHTHPIRCYNYLFD
jgi:hypothetical protein